MNIEPLPGQDDLTDFTEQQLLNGVSMSTKQKPEQPTEYVITDLPNEDYHNLSALGSTSTKAILDDPALYIWSEDAPQDKSKLTATEFGQDFHLYFLESDSFEAMYQELPAFNRRKADEKQAELDLIEEWKAKGITPITAEMMEKCKAMKASALAHPTVKAIMNMDGVAEHSYFWRDELSGVYCKCRPDWLVKDINDSNRLPDMPKDAEILIMDVKTIGQFDRMESQIENLKYHVSAAHYKRGVELIEGKKACFVFVFVSTSMQMGRYPVQVVTLSDAAMFDGNESVEFALSEYARLQASDNSAWQTMKVLDRPAWAIKQEDVF